ncbi:MAG: hypothetical protein V1703_04880, partial [Candidatus Altiarchaeota archaeon]
AVAGVSGMPAEGTASGACAQVDRELVIETARPLLSALHTASEKGLIKVDAGGKPVADPKVNYDGKAHMFEALSDGDLRLLLATPTGDTAQERKESQAALLKSMAEVVAGGVTVVKRSVGGSTHYSLAYDDIDRIKDALQHNMPVRPAHPGMGLK